MKLKEFVETNKKINKYEESGKLTIELASDLNELEKRVKLGNLMTNLLESDEPKYIVELNNDLEDELDDDYDVEHEKVKLIKTMRQVVENNKLIEQKFSKLINMFENLQNQVDSLEIT